MNLTIVIPYKNGGEYIGTLLETIPDNLPVIVVDDLSDVPFKSNKQNVTAVRLSRRGYFTGAVNQGIHSCKTDVLVLNQDVRFVGTEWLDLIIQNRERYAMIGERISGEHPAHPNGYIHGTFMFARRDAIDSVGYMNATMYPLWGSTCEWQLRFCRAGYEVLPLRHIPGFIHERGERPFGSSIKQQLEENPSSKSLMIRTPPLVSVVINSYQHGKYLQDAINSLIGGPTSLGIRPPQTLQSFEVIVVDDASTDNTPEVMSKLASSWTGIRYIRHERNTGSASACNTGINAANAPIIAIMDSDDMMEPDRLEEMYWATVGNPNHVVYDDIKIIRYGDYLRDEFGEIKAWKMRDYHFDTMLSQNIMHKGLMFPKKAWEDAGGYPESMNTGREDWAFNVALGRAGWCGLHISYAGYLYRREGQNRTLDNTTPEHRQVFLSRMKKLYPDLYRGVRPMGCCGSSKTSLQKAGIVMSNTLLVGDNGMTQIEYVGLSSSTMPYYGSVTRTRYDIGGKRRVVWIDSKDWPGFDDIYDGSVKAFKLYTPEPVRRPQTINIDPSPTVLAGAAFAAGASLVAGMNAGVVQGQAVDDTVDVSSLTVAEVKLYVEGKSLDVVRDVLLKEQSGKNRISLVNYLNELLS